MKKLDLDELNVEGDFGFDELNDLEKNLYVLLLFSSLYEMEGITHFISHHLHQLPRLLSFLELIKSQNLQELTALADFFKQKSGGTWDLDRFRDFLNNASDDDRKNINQLGSACYANFSEMWSKAQEYVRANHAIDFDPLW